MQFSKPAILALLSIAPFLVAAVPTTMSKRSPITPEEHKEILAFLAESDTSFGPVDITERSITNRGSLNQYPGVLNRDEVPNCLEEKYDPSYARQEIRYPPESGTKIERRGDHDECDTGKGKNHCWTEAYYTEKEIIFDGWENTGFAIDCATSSSCQSTTVNLEQSCKSHQSSTENGFDLGFEIKIKSLPGFSNLAPEDSTFGPKYSFRRTTADTTLTCRSDAGQATCSFDDKKCHSIWSAQRNMIIHGYIQRVCMSSANLVQQNTQIRGNQFVRGQIGISKTMPINKIVGCAAMCGAPNYPDPTPVEGNGRVPFTFDDL